MSAPSPRSFLVTETIDLLLYISKTQSFTETSRLMGLSQSMVSRKLSALRRQPALQLLTEAAVR